MVKRIYRKSLITGIPGCVDVTVLVSREMKGRLSGEVRTIEEHGVVCSNDLGRDRNLLINRAVDSAKFKGSSKLLNKNLRTQKGRDETYEAIYLNANISAQILDIRFYYTVDPETKITTKTMDGKRYNVVERDGEIVQRERMRYYKDPINYIEDPDRTGFR